MEKGEQRLSGRDFPKLWVAEVKATRTGLMKFQNIHHSPAFPNLDEAVRQTAESATRSHFNNC